MSRCTNTSGQHGRWSAGFGATAATVRTSAPVLATVHFSCAPGVPPTVGTANTWPLKPGVVPSGRFLPFGSSAERSSMNEAFFGSVP